MTAENPPPESGQVRVNLAAQVAGIAAQASAALSSDDAEKRRALEGQLRQVRAQLLAGPAPEGLVPFIDAVCGLLRGEDVSVLASELPPAFRAVYEQLVEEAGRDDSEGDLTLGEVLDEVTYNVVVAVSQGSLAQRRMMANTLQRMEGEAARRPDLEGLIDFLQAARALLLDEDWAQPASRLSGPFQARWESLLVRVCD